MHFMFKNRANYISQQHTAKHNLCMVFILSISLEVLCTDSLNQSRVSCPNRICCEVQLFLLKSNLETMWNRGAQEKRNSRILSSNTISFEEHKDLSPLSRKKVNLNSIQRSSPHTPFITKRTVPTSRRSVG